MSFVRNLLLRGAGVTAAARPRRPDVLPELEPAETEQSLAPPAESQALSALPQAQPDAVPREVATPGLPAEARHESDRQVVRAPAGATGETTPPMPGEAVRPPIPAPHGTPPGEVVPGERSIVVQPAAAAPPAAVREIVTLLEPRESPSPVIREVHETRLETRELLQAASSFAEPREAVALPLPVATPAPASIDIEIGTIEILQAAPMAPPPRPVTPRRQQPRGFAGLVRQRQYADRRWY